MRKVVFLLFFFLIVNKYDRIQLIGEIFMKRCVVIYNPVSGKKIKIKFLDEYKKILFNKGYDSEIIYTEYRGHAISIVKNLDDNVNLVISIGGDGTFNEVMTGNFLRKKKLLLSHLPTGTTNDLCKMLGYGKNIIDNLKMTLDGEVKGLDICTIHGRPFVYVAGFGKFTDIAYETSRKNKEKFGYFAYLTEGIKSFFNKTKLYDITYEIDGNVYRGLFSFVIISSANRISGINNFYKDVKLDDDKFEVLFCNITRKKDIAKILYFLTMYDVSKVPGIYFYRTNNLKIKFDNIPKKSWCIDGEELKMSSSKYNINIINDVKMLIPSKNISKLFINYEKNNN